MSETQEFRRDWVNVELDGGLVSVQVQEIADRNYWHTTELHPEQAVDFAKEIIEVAGQTKDD